MSNHEKIVYIILAVIWIRIIWQGVCIKELEKENERLKQIIIDWLNKISDAMEVYMDIPDNLRDYEKQWMVENQKRAKEWAKEWAKEQGEKNVK